MGVVQVVVVLLVVVLLLLLLLLVVVVVIEHRPLVQLDVLCRTSRLRRRVRPRRSHPVSPTDGCSSRCAGAS